MENNIDWTENIIVADADYIDRVAFNLTVNFERMIGRRIPPADLAQWAVCIALDGGLRQGKHNTHLILIHDKDSQRLQNFQPADYDKELNARAFTDDMLGEFTIAPVAVEKEMVDKSTLMLDIVGTLCQQQQVKRIMVVPNAEEGTLYDDLRATLRHLDDDSKHITLFAMQPMPGGNFKQEILGYSIMNALGIKGEELKQI